MVSKQQQLDFGQQEWGFGAQKEQNQDSIKRESGLQWNMFKV